MYSAKVRSPLEPPNPKNRMMRYFYSLCFLVGGMGLPLLAKEDLSSADAKGQAAPRSVASTAATPAKKTHATPFVVITPRLQHSPLSYALFPRQGEAGRAVAGVWASTVSSAGGIYGARLARVTAYWPSEGRLLHPPQRGRDRHPPP